MSETYDANTVNIPGKLNVLEREMHEVLETLDYHRKEVDMLKLRKQTVEEVLIK